MYLPGPMEMPLAAMDWIGQPFTEYRRRLDFVVKGLSDLAKMPQAAAMDANWKAVYSGVVTQVDARIKEVLAVVVKDPSSPYLLSSLGAIARDNMPRVTALQGQVAQLGKAFKSTTGVEVASTDPRTAGTRDTRGVFQVLLDGFWDYWWVTLPVTGYFGYRWYQKQGRYPSPPKYATRR